MLFYNRTIHEIDKIRHINYFIDFTKTHSFSERKDWREKIIIFVLLKKNRRYL